MRIYCNSVGGFIKDCDNHVIANMVIERMEQLRIGGEGPGQFRAWSNSLPFVAEVLKDKEFDPDIGVGIEYQLIGTRQRVDFLVYGLGNKAQENLVLIELKQWSTVEPSNLEDYVFTDGGDGPDDYWHPSYQALNYANIMRNFNVYVYEHQPSFVVELRRGGWMQGLFSLKL